MHVARACGWPAHPHALRHVRPLAGAAFLGRDPGPGTRRVGAGAAAGLVVRPDCSGRREQGPSTCCRVSARSGRRSGAEAWRYCTMHLPFYSAIAGANFGDRDPAFIISSDT